MLGISNDINKAFCTMQLLRNCLDFVVVIQTKIQGKCSRKDSSLDLGWKKQHLPLLAPLRVNDFPFNVQMIQIYFELYLMKLSLW